MLNNLPTKDEIESFAWSQYTFATAKQIAEHFDLSISKVRKLLKDYKIEVIYLKTDQGKKDLYQYYMIENHSLPDTAKHFNCPVKRIRRFITEYGFKKSKRCQIECMKNTQFERYGQWYWTTDEFKEKAIITNNNKYSKDWFSGTDEWREKTENTLLKRYGVKNPAQSKQVIDAIRKINLEKYGFEWNLQRPEVIAASHSPEACLKRHNSRKSHRYIYDNERFDSSWELALWIYAKDYNEKIEHESIVLQYYDDCGSLHSYIPDFVYNDLIVEVKGDQYLDEDYNLIDLYDEDTCGKIKAKNNCMKNNNVVIFAGKEIEPYLTYIIDTYGNTYLNTFRVK